MSLNDYDEFSASVMDESNWPYNHAEIGSVEIGEAIAPFEAIMSEPAYIGNVEIGNTEIGAGLYEQDNVEIGAEAVRRVIKKARDNRQPPPQMEALDVDGPEVDLDDWGLTDVFLGAAEATGSPDPFPMTAQFLQRFGAGGDERIVRVDTPDSYKQFRAENSPEMADLSRRLAELQDRLAAHERDPYAHDRIAEEIEDLTLVGEEVDKVEASKRVDLWLPQRFEGKWSAWTDGDFVCASIVLPGCDGEVRICTSLEPIRKCVTEMAKHASEANVPAATVVGVLPAMGCVLGAGTVIKEMASAAPSILLRPEAKQKGPFMVRIAPKANPALCALAALAQECAAGNQQACDEWQNLATLGPAPVKQAMTEAVALLKQAAA